MQLISAILCFAFFVLSFFAGTALRYVFFIEHNFQSLGDYSLLVLCVVVSALFLHGCLKALQLTSEGAWRSAGKSLFLTGLLFVSVGVCEEEFSEALWLKPISAHAFGELEGHCGVYSGRTVLKLFHEFSPDEVMSRMLELQTSNRCRFRHLNFLRSRALSGCLATESKSNCEVRWMDSFAERGYWNSETRKYFSNLILDDQGPAASDEMLIAYALKDQELGMGKKSLAAQLDLKREGDATLARLQLKEDETNEKLSREIVGAIANRLPNSASPPPPYLLKFRELQEEIALRPETPVKYNPSR